MTRRERWRRVLDLEVQRWSAMPYGELTAELSRQDNYTIEVDSQEYQVEVGVLEDMETYLRVMLAVDDGTLPASIVPATASFIRRKPPPQD